MGRATHLVDTSAFTRITKPAVAAALGPLVVEGRVALCRPVAFELGYSARSSADYMSIMDLIDAFEFVPVTDGDHERALDLQLQLAASGQHRAISLVDALVAAVAETRSLTVLHYDKDFELIATITGQPTQWVVEPGTVD